MTATVTTRGRPRPPRDILDHGYAVVKLSDIDATEPAERDRHGESSSSERPLEDKIAHGSTDHNYGYRPFGIEYSVTPDRPDMNECFTVWSSRLDLIPQRRRHHRRHRVVPGLARLARPARAGHPRRGRAELPRGPARRSSRRRRTCR